MRVTFVLLAAIGLCSIAPAGPDSIPADDVTFPPAGPTDRSGGIALYSNLETPDPNGYGYYYDGTPFGDDLHMVSGGLLDGFSFIYHDPEGGTALSEVRVLFYANDPDDPNDYPGGNPPSPLLGSYLVSDLPGDGEWTVTADVSADPLPLPCDVWMEFEFIDSSEAGLLMYYPATVGYSNPWFEIHGEGIFWFG